MKNGKVFVKYIPLGRATVLEGNPKLHDVEKLKESIRRHGFKMPPRFEPKLNRGKGGIVAGNGRIEAVIAMKRGGEKPPRGIIAKNNQWFVPVLFGVDAISEKAAKAYAVDDNNLTMGDGYANNEIARLWDMDGYLALLKDADKDFLVSMEQEDIEALLFQGKLHPNNAEDEWKGMPEFNQEDKTAFKSIIVHFKNQKDVNQFSKLVEQTITEKTRSIWYPEAEIDRYADKRYVDAA